MYSHLCGQNSFEMQSATAKWFLKYKFVKYVVFQQAISGTVDDKQLRI